jgi:hypothetical protein
MKSHSLRLPAFSVGPHYFRPAARKAHRGEQTADREEGAKNRFGSGIAGNSLFLKFGFNFSGLPETGAVAAAEDADGSEMEKEFMPSGPGD